MVTVLFPSTLRPLVGGASQLEVPGATALETLRQLQEQEPTRPRALAEASP